jgi:hypothetical protein
MIDLSSGIIEIDGCKWYTRECFMAEFGIKKSNFYNQIKAGNIKSRKLFEHPNTLFYVYANCEAEVCND